MRHLEPEDVALAALGEELPADARDHLAGCETCAAELASLREAVLAGRAAGPDALVPPPPGVWDGVRRELGLPPDVRPSTGPAPVPAPAPQPAPPSASAAPQSPSTASTTSSTSTGAAARHPVRWLAVAAAGGLVLGAGGATWWASRPSATTVVEEATLEPLPGWPDASGTAVVERAADGTRTLVIDVDAAPGDGVREVWLIDTDVTRLISLGLLTGSTGSFDLPADVDLAQYPVVDVSEEPLDGDPAHSGDSVVRGVLGT